MAEVGLDISSEMYKGYGWESLDSPNPNQLSVKLGDKRREPWDREARRRELCEDVMKEQC